MAEDVNIPTGKHTPVIGEYQIREHNSVYAYDDLNEEGVFIQTGPNILDSMRIPVRDIKEFQEQIKKKEGNDLVEKLKEWDSFELFLYKRTFRYSPEGPNRFTKEITYLPLGNNILTPTLLLAHNMYPQDTT
ncbi:MAG: hypothetical protein KJ674_02190 [Nanoarchaeota archaeon]|nr:hypothetical protein [Nanoarchaeota archaeon]